MKFLEKGEYWKDILIFTAAAVVLYEIGVLSFFFIVPLQILAKRQDDDKALLFSSFFVLLAVLITALVNTRGVESSELKNILIFLELILPVMLTASLYAVNTRWSRNWRNLYRLLGVTLAVGIVSVPIIVFINRNEVFLDFFREQISLVVEAFAGVFGAGVSDVDAGGIVGRFLQPDNILETMRAIFFRNYLFSFFIILIVNWRIGSGIAARMGKGSAPVLLRFHLPQRFIWVFLLSWAGILGDIFFGLGAIGYFVWNIGLISLFLYGLQGLGILRFFLQKANLTRGLQTFITVMVLVLLIIPGFNLLVILGIPIFGVSEVWIPYRKKKRSDEA